MVARNGAGGGLPCYATGRGAVRQRTDVGPKVKQIASRFNSHVSELACNVSRCSRP